MTRYEAPGKIGNITWKGQVDPLALRGHPPARKYHPVELTVTITAGELTGLDPTRPITITQEVAADE